MLLVIFTQPSRFLTVCRLVVLAFTESVSVELAVSIESAISIVALAQNYCSYWYAESRSSLNDCLVQRALVRR